MSEDDKTYNEINITLFGFDKDNIHTLLHMIEDDILNDVTKADVMAKNDEPIDYHYTFQITPHILPKTDKE